MSDNLLDRLLGDDRDPGCEASFDVLDEYAEALLRGADVDRLFPVVVAHLAGCAACREDTEGLVAYLSSDAPDDSR